MNTLARRSAPAFVLAFLAACLFVRLASFGIWDPWELERADSARALLGGEGPKGFVGLSTWAVAMGFRQFDVHEWSGRMPIALFGLLTILTAYAIGRRVSDARGALYTAVVAATSPLFLLNARQMLGVAPSFFAQALFGFALVSLVRTLVAPDRSTTRRDLAVWSLFAMATGALAAFAAGVLQGVLAPLVAAAIVPPLFGRASGGDSARTMVYGALALAAAGLTAGTVNAILHPESASALWIGGSPVSGTPPTFEIALERIFHGFAPWSALLPAAIAVTIGAGMWTPDPDAAPASPVDAETDAGRTDARLYLVLWAAFGYAALTYFSSHYGNTTYLPVVALAALVASFLRDVERSDSEWWVAGIVSALLAALIIRDFDLYPSSPLGGLTVGEVEVPDVFHPNMIWAALLGAFAVVTGLVFGIAPIPTRLDLRAPFRALRSLWRTGTGQKIWLVLAALLCVALVALGVTAAVAAKPLHLTTVAAKWAKRVAVLPVLVPIGFVVAQVGLWLLTRLGRFRVVPVLVVGGVIGAYVAQGFLPTLSAHFSPREVYDRYNALAKAGEPLGEYRLGSRAAAYYARGDVKELKSQDALVKFLAEPGRRWAVIPADELAAVDRNFRQAAGRHLFVADNRSARVVLASNEQVSGVSNKNFVANSVLREAPKIEHPVNVNFEGRVELLGYALKLPHNGYVGAGESFEVTWYWKALRGGLGSYKVFVHVDGDGQRLNGDHDPVDGKYPVRLWDEGDIIVDRQELKIPSNYGAGTYTLYLGLFSGENRMKITGGPADSDNRANAGTLTVR